MHHPRLAWSAAVAALAFAGCSEAPVTEPDLAADAVVDPGLAAANLAFEVPSRHLVVFRNAAPRNFERQVEELGGTVLLNHKIGVAVVAGLDDEAASALRRSTGAQFVEEQPDFRLIEPAGVSEPSLVGPAALESAQEPVPASPSDPTTAIYYFAQWNMHQIHAEAAWAEGRLGSEAVTVAILDTGIDYLLPDLAGLVDLDRSVSFEPMDDMYAALFFPGRHPITDLHFHGTNVASQVASNATRFAGVTSKTTLMGVKVCSVLGGCGGVAQGILHAIDNGADIINMSLGGWFRKSAFPGAVAAYDRIMNYAAQQGVTVVVSAGNDANDLDRQDNIAIKDNTGKIIDRIHIPSFFSVWCDATHVICVSATRRNDVPASYTNYGRSAIDVAAPGGERNAALGITDWVYSQCPQTSLLFNCAGGYFVIGVAGTSQAAPHVSGLAALAVEDVGRNPAKVRAYIRNSADAMEGGNSPYFGKGRINVATAVGAY